MASLNYNHLRYFWTVAREGGLGRVAKRLNLTQSALSVQIKRLEEQLGHDLFDRVGRGLVLTEAGRIAQGHADVIFAAGDDLIGTLRETGQSRHVLRVGAQATLSRNFQLSFLRPILGRDDIEVVLRSGTPSELLRALSVHQLDAVLTTQPPTADPERAFLSHKLSEQPVGLVGRRDLVGGIVDYRELLRLRPVILPPLHTGFRDDIDALTHRLGLSPRIAAQVDDMAMMRLLVREGVGVGVLPPIVIADELAQDLLIVGAALPGIVERFYAVTVDRTFRNALLQQLLAQSFS